MCVCVCVCVCYHLISEATRFNYQDELLMDRMGSEELELPFFFCKNVSLRRCSSFSGLVLHHLELLMSAKKSQILTMLFTLKVTESCYGFSACFV